jgi:hypothetical protein
MSLSLAERERRAKERAAASNRSPKPKSPSADDGGSLFDKYAGLAGARQSTDEEEVEELMHMLGSTPGSQRLTGRALTGQQEYFLEANWDPSPHRNPPAALKHIKPQTREPWAIDAAIYNTSKGAVNTLDFGQPERYGLNVNPALTHYREDVEDKRPKTKGKKPAPAWNAQPFRSVPYALRGIRPAPHATDPWVYDHKNRRGNFEDTDVIENATVTELDNGGASDMLNKKRDGWDSSTTTPWRADGRYGRVRGIN